MVIAESILPWECAEYVLGRSIVILVCVCG